MEVRLVEQEGVVALVGRDLDEADIGAGRFSARAMARLSAVGNSQSEVNETMQKRVRVPRNAAARSPP